MDITTEIAAWIVNTAYEDIPKKVIEVSKKSVVDTLSCLIAGSNEPGGKDAADLVKGWGGKQESTVFVHGGKVPAAHAAFANATMARAIDFGEVHEPTRIHPSECIVPAAFAVAEMKGAVNGKELLNAITLGKEIAIRINLAPKLGIGKTGFTTMPSFGAAIAAGKLMRLNREQMIDALGLAYCHGTGNLQPYDDGCLGVRLQTGFDSRSGMLSAIMAERGLTGCKQVFEGKYGFFNVYHRDTEVDLAKLTDGLGEIFTAADVSIKPYPCCKYTTGPIYTALKLLQAENIDHLDIDEITVYTNDGGMFCAQPADRKYEPKTRVDAQFSTPYTVAVAAMKGDVTISDFTEEAISNPHVRDFATKVKVMVEPEFNRLSPNMIPPTIVEIKTKDGQTFSMRKDSCKGDPKNPMSFEECQDKFRKCIPYAAKPLPEKLYGFISETLPEIQDVEDVGQLIKQLG